MNNSRMTEAMTPHLPRPDDAVLSAQGASFEDRVLLLLGAVALADGVLTAPTYDLVAGIVRDIFGDRAMDASVQARFHYALLHPPQDPENLALSLAREASQEKVSGEQIEALLIGLDKLCDGKRHVGGRTRALREAMDIAFSEQRLEQRRLSLARKGGLGQSATALWESGAHLGVNMGRAAVGGTLSLMHTMTGVAGRILPWRKAKTEEETVPTAPVAAYNAALAEDLENLTRAAWVLEDGELQKELEDFRRILADQPFKVVMLGEGKRGKSSLINALLGEDLSPVRESVPETASVAEFSYAPTPHYQVRFLDEEAYAHLEDYLTGEEENLLLRDKVAAWKNQTLQAQNMRPRGLFHLTSQSALHDYLGTEGRFSSWVGRVGIALPLELLSGGMVLVDTPGLNASDAFHDYLAYEECLTADCLVVVLDARRPDSASELRLLRKLAAAGRAVAIIGVMSGIDRLNNSESLDQAADRALTILLEACRGTEALHVLGLVPINARQAMLQRCYPAEHKPDPASANALRELFALLRDAMGLDLGQEEYRRKVAGRCSQLAAFAEKRLRASFERYRATLPEAPFLELLERHADQLAAASLNLADQAASVISAAAHDVDEWRMDQARRLDDWEEMLVLRVMDAARRRADELDKNFAKESAWKNFDDEEAPRIARQCLDEFLSQEQEKLYAWNEKLRLFNEEVRELSTLCLKAVEESSAELGDICATNGSMDHFLVQTNAHMRRLAVFLTGAGSGLLAGSLLNIVAMGSAAFALLTNPLVLPGAALITVAAYALQSLGKLEKRKKAFLDRKEKKTRQWAAEVRFMLEAELQAAREEVAAAYKNAVARGFVPALEIVTMEAAHLRLYLDVMDKIREDTDNFESSVGDMVAKMKMVESV